MIKSMTGYASESFFVETTKYIVEAKSVNSKILDLKIRLPQFLKNKEFEIRKLVSKELVRGKIELNVIKKINRALKKYLLTVPQYSNTLKS